MTGGVLREGVSARGVEDQIAKGCDAAAGRRRGGAVRSETSRPAGDREGDSIAIVSRQNVAEWVENLTITPGLIALPAFVSSGGGPKLRWSAAAGVTLKLSDMGPLSPPAEPSASVYASAASSTRLAKMAMPALAVTVVVLALAKPPGPLATVSVILSLLSLATRLPN